MPNVRIDQLPHLIAPSADDILPIVDMATSTTHYSTIGEILTAATASVFSGYLYTSSFNTWTGSKASVLAGSASYSNYAATASYVNFITSSVTSASLAQTASYSKNAQSASYVDIAQTASYSALAQTASYLNVTGSGIYVNWNGAQLQLTASISGAVELSNTASLALLAETASYFFTSSVTNAEYAATASYFVTNSVSSASLAETASYFFTSSVTSASLAFASLFTNSSSYSAYSDLALTASYVLLADTASYFLTSSVTNAEYAATASYFFTSSVTNAEYAATASYFLTSSVSSASLAATASYFFTSSVSSASYVSMIAGPGIEAINYEPGGIAITSSVRSVNGIYPTNGNVSIALSGVVLTGTDAMRVTSGSTPSISGSITEGTTWIVAGDPDGNKNGTSFVYNTDPSGSWLALSAASLGSTDSRYLMLAPQAPLSGSLSLGNFKITNLATPTTSTDAVNLGYVTASLAMYLTTASFNSWTGSNLSKFSGTASLAGTASYFLTSSVTSASLAQTASYFLTSSVTSASLAATSSNAINLNGTGSNGFVSNVGDAYTSVALVMRIVSLTAAEYSALAVKDANTFYAVV